MPSQSKIETTQIPGTELKPSRIGLGTWAIGGWMWGGPDDDAAIETIIARSIGHNAHRYGARVRHGHSEEVVGRALRGRRDRVVVATKVALE